MVTGATWTGQEAAWALAPLIAGRPRVRWGHWNGRLRKWEYRARDERDLTDRVPNVPAAVMIYSAEGLARVFVADVDVVGSDGALLTHEVVALLERCGGRVVVDRSPAGKHHVYLPLRDGISVERASRLARALAVRFPGVDALPHATGAVSGCIRPPGSPYKDGSGFQELVTDLDSARRVLMTRNGADVLARLEAELTEELAQDARARMQLVRPVEELEAEAQVLTAPGLGAVLSERMAAVATEGVWEQTGYADRSSARMAVLCAAARAGMRHEDVAARVEDGRWAGLGSLYRNATTPWRRLLVHEWKKALAFVGAGSSSQKPVRHCNTSEVEVTRGGPGGLSSFEAHRFIRRWRGVLHRVEREEFRGRQGMAARLVLRALAAAAHTTGTVMVEFGVRSLSLSSPGSASSVSRALAELRNADDPWIVLEQDGRGTRADLYSLRIPARYAELAEQTDLVAGKAEALRPVFRELGAASALVFEAIERGADTVLSASRLSGVSRSTAHEVIAELEAWGLVERDDDGGLVARADRLRMVAERLGVPLVIARMIVRFTAERRAWREYLARRHDPMGAGETWWAVQMRSGPPAEAMAG